MKKQFIYITERANYNHFETIFSVSFQSRQRYGLFSTLGDIITGR